MEISKDPPIRLKTGDGRFSMRHNEQGEWVGTADRERVYSRNHDTTLAAFTEARGLPRELFDHGHLSNSSCCGALLGKLSSFLERTQVQETMDPNWPPGTRMARAPSYSYDTQKELTPPPAPAAPKGVTREQIRKVLEQDAGVGVTRTLYNIGPALDGMLDLVGKAGFLLPDPLPPGTPATVIEPLSMVGRLSDATIAEKVNAVIAVVNRLTNTEKAAS